MNEKSYNGANWVRIDLHLHSPYVESFKLPAGFDLNSSDARKNLAEEYVKKLEESQIKVGAITDYNEIHQEWFKLIREKAQNKGITLFPGEELSLKLTAGKYGIHILLIFEQDADIDGLSRLLYSFDKNPEDPLVKGRSHRDIESKIELEELIKQVRSKFNCLIVFPHPEEEKGLLKTFNPSQSAIYLRDIKPDAIEYISDGSMKKLLSTNELSSDYFDKIAIIENTDPKSLEDIGLKKRDNRIRATYYKLSSFSIDALKTALHDPEVRIRIYDCPCFCYDRISRVAINGSSFLKDLEIYFNPELNTFIGGRGVGKSAIIETIRYAMDLPVYAGKSEKLDFVNSVVGSGGEISILVERYYGKTKKEYEIRRTLGKETEIYEKDGAKTDFSVHSLFEEAKYPIVIGQKELYYLATTPAYQLELIDELIGEQVRLVQDEFNKLIERLRENAIKLLSLKERVSKKEEYEQRLKEIEAEIKVFKDLGVEEKLKRWTDIIDDEQKLKNAIGSVNKINEGISSFFNEVLSELFEIIKSIKTAKSENKYVLEKLSGEVDEIRRAIEQTKQKLLETINDRLKNIDRFSSEWLEKKAAVEAEMQMIKRELGGKSLEPEKLERLTRERAKLMPLIEELKRQEKNIKDLEKKREEIRNELGRKRHEIFQVREKQSNRINEVLKERLRVEVKYEKDKGVFRKSFMDLVKGSGISIDAIDALISAPDKLTDGLLISYYIQQHGQKLQEEFNLTPAMSNRLIGWFKEPERLYDLETLFPEDKIEIYLRVNSEYKTIDKLSVGQKATSLLLLLFAQEDRIMILDQPEEDLDNRFIYEDVVKILREMKGKRQLLIATHNANIPVLGDSELIIVLESQNDRCAVVHKGSIDKDDIKADVKNIMEGGEEAFRIRAQKYGEI
jgi:DNA repair ATPase RecN